MRLPIKRKQAAQYLTLPDLSGGLNMRDGISEVLDNQLTDCKNVFWDEGVLKTRPSITEASKMLLQGDAGYYVKAPITLHNCYKIYRGTKIQLCSVSTTSKTKTTNEENETVIEKFEAHYINFFWLRADGLENFSKITFTSESDIPKSYFVCQYANTLYCFTNTEKNIGTIFKADVNKGTWEKVENTEYYVPLVAMSCKKIASDNATTQEALASGVMIDGFNILSDYYKMSFNSYNPDIVTEENQSHKMRYHIIESVAKSKYMDKKVTAEYTKDGEVYRHEVTLNGQTTASTETGVKEDGLQMRVYRNTVSFWDENNNQALISEGGENDLVITAPYITSDKEKNKVFGMTRCEWFGGGSAGLSGGTRLFLCNNDDNPDLVTWSGLNNPLYFPENSNFNVGNETSRVTGFGKQADKLIIYKETETWSTEYVQNTNIDAESLINGNVVDFASSSVYFPLTQINPIIGCIYPDTVQLCRNRLMWLGNDDKVYTLVSESPYTERSIYCVSEMVERKIREVAREYDISNATACDWNGYYCLLLKNNILVMDYNCYGYTHIASHSKTEDANVKIPWFLWEIPNGSCLINVGNTLVTAEFEYNESGSKVRSFYFTDSNCDKIMDDLEKHIKVPIDSSFTTKIFTFGAPHIRKNIEQINLQLANNGGEPIEVFFVTENGTEQTNIITKGAEFSAYTAGYIDSHAVFPCIKNVVKFGLRLESRGALAIDSAVLKFRVTGGAR